MESRAYFGALLLNKHCAALLSNEERRLERQRKLMYNRVWKEKELLMDDYIHINVRTPSPQRTGSSLAAAASDRQRFEPSPAVASVHRRGFPSVASRAASEAFSDQRRVKSSTPVAALQRHASSAALGRRSAPSSSASAKRVQRSISSGAVFEQSRAKSLVPSVPRASGATAAVSGHPERAVSDDVHRPPSTDSVSGRQTAGYTERSRPYSQSVSARYRPNRPAASVSRSLSLSGVLGTTPRHPHPPAPNSSAFTSQAVTNAENSSLSSSLPGSHRGVSSAGTKFPARRTPTSTEDRDLSNSGRRVADMERLRSQTGVQMHDTSSRDTSGSDQGGGVTVPKVSESGLQDAVSPHQREDSFVQEDTERERCHVRSDFRSVDVVEKTQSRVSSDKNEDNFNPGHYHHDTVFDQRSVQIHSGVTQIDHSDQHGEEQFTKHNHALKGYEEEPSPPPPPPQTHKKLHVRQMTLDPKLVLPLTAKRYRCSKQATIIPVITVYGRQATLYPNAEAKAGRVVTMDRRTRGWIERSTSILSFLEKLYLRG